MSKYGPALFLPHFSKNNLIMPSVYKQAIEAARQLYIETLIDSYQEQECLWNMSIPDYKIKRKRTLAFEAINDTMETAAEVTDQIYRQMGQLEDTT